MKVISRRPAGQVAGLFALATIALLGAVALGTDVAVMYENWAIMQKSVDAGALAGASYLPNDQSDAKATAISYATKNGLMADEISTPTISPDNLQLTVTASRTVPYFFGRVLGLTSQTLKVSATASVPGSTSCIGCAYLGTNNSYSYSASYGSTTGQYGLEPVGVDVHTNYQYQQAITLHNGHVGAGNWDTLALGGVGGNNLRNRLAAGYSGPANIGDLVDTEPGHKVGPVDQGLQDRLNLANQLYPNGTFSNHAPDDPRVMFFPLVDWSTNPNGRTAMAILGFCSVWLDSANGGDIGVHFISQVAPESLTNATAPSAGTRGNAVLIK